MPSLRATALRGVVRLAVRARDPMAARPGPAQLTDEQLHAAVVELRHRLEVLAELGPAPTHVMVEAVDEPVPSDWVVSEDAEPDRVVLHLHGGAYFAGSPRTHRRLAADLSRAARARVLVPDYRLAPEHAFPAALEDALAVYKWLLARDDVDPGRVAVTGDSAGGGLALSVLLAAREEGLPLPASYVGLSPWTDLGATGRTLTTKSEADPVLSGPLVARAAEVYVASASPEDPLISPLYGDLKGLPPMLVHVGSEEVLLDDARRLVTRAREAGVPADLAVFDGLWHVFHAFPGTPEAARAWREIGGFVRRTTAAGARRVR